MQRLSSLHDPITIHGIDDRYLEAISSVYYLTGLVDRLALLSPRSSHRYGRVDSKDEEFLRLQKRIQYLEGRLAEAQVMMIRKPPLQSALRT